MNQQSYTRRLSKAAIRGALIVSATALFLSVSMSAVYAQDETPHTQALEQEAVEEPSSNWDPRRQKEELRKKILGMLVGSAIGDALGAPTEMWPREKVQAHFNFIVDLRDTVRDPSPEGSWSLNGPPGTTTDDTRWKKLIVEYLMQEQKQGVRKNPPPSAHDFAQFIIDTQALQFQEIKAINADDLDTYVEVTHKLLWLKEWVRVSEAYLQQDIDGYAAALNRFYGGDLTCAGVLYSPVIGAKYPGDPEMAYRVTYDLSIFDIGYARDISGLTAAMVSASLEDQADEESVLRVLWQVDPNNYFKSRLVGRMAYKLYDDARLIVYEARRAEPEQPPPVPLTEQELEILQLTTAYELLDKVSRQHAFHAAEIHLVNLTAILYADWDFEQAMRFVISYGRDNDTTAAVTGAILGAYHGIDGLPPAWVDRVLERNLEMGIDLSALADGLTEEAMPCTPQ